MTGLDVIQKALLLLNYTDNAGHADSRVSGAAQARGLSILNQLLADAWYAEHDDTPFVPLNTASETLPCGDRVAADVLPYGVAMMLAQGEGDGDNQTLFAALYNQKRAAYTHTATRENRLP